MRVVRAATLALCCLSFGALVASEEPGDRFYQAVRNNDLTSLRVMVTTSDVNLRDSPMTEAGMSAAGHRSFNPISKAASRMVTTNGSPALPRLGP